MTNTYAPTSTFSLVMTDPRAAAARSALLRTKIATAVNLPDQDKATLRSLIAGDIVPTADIHRAIVSGLGVAITRKGQSMARRSDREALMALYALLPTPTEVLPVEDKAAARALDRATLQASVAQQEAGALRDTVVRLQRDLESARLNLAAVRPQAADLAADQFAYSLLTADQRQRVSDFRTGYRAAESAR